MRNSPVSRRGGVARPVRAGVLGAVALIAGLLGGATVRAEDPAPVVSPGPSAGPTPFTPMDVFALELANDPQISPDGTQIVYVRSKADILKDSYVPMLWTVNADGTRHMPLTAADDMAGSPAWSPDGKRLAYTAVRDGARQIVIRWMDSGIETTIGGLPTDPGDLSWSPDGRLIAFSMFVPEQGQNFSPGVVPPPGAEWKPPPITVDTPLYRADMAGNIPAGKMHMFVVAVDGGTPRQLTGPDVGYFPFIGSAYDWAADSKSLVIALNRNSAQDIVRGRMFDTGLYRLPVDGGQMTPILDDGDLETSPQVSPDGRYVAYIARSNEEKMYVVGRLMLWDSKTGKTRVLSPDIDNDVMAARWAADGKSLVGYYTERGENKLARFDLKGRHTDLAAGLGMVHSAYLAAPSFSMSGTGRIAMQWASPDSTGNIAVVGPKGGTPKPVTDLNVALLEQRLVGKLEEITYTSSKDDLEIQGWILYPPGFDPAKTYPLVLEIHGGPNTAYGPRFDMEKQLIAAAGYVVLYTNPRGSSSYGGDFGNMIQNAFPGDEYYDLMSGVDAVLDRGFIDPDRLYVTGGSGGGTLTAWLIANTDRFRAAVSCYPVIDWQSQALTSDIMGEVFSGFFFGTPWSQPEDYRRRSLLSTVDRVKTPVMVLTGEVDYRTPISESEQYFAALQYHGVESTFVRVPMENHGIRRYPSHFAQKMANIVGWFEAHK